MAATTNLSGKVAVITGGGGVLGACFAKAMAQAGAAVAILDINETAAETVAQTIRDEGGTALVIAANVLDRTSLEAAYVKILEDLGSCDILINGAGGNNPRGTTDDEYFDPTREGLRTFFDLDPEGIRFVFDLNCIGVLLTTQVFAKGMIGRPGACIINVSSMNAYRPLTKIPAYSGAKAAVSNLTQWMAVYFAKAGIRVNALAPGFFVSNQNHALLFDPEGNPTPRAEKILRGTPMGRFGRPDELLGTLFWLLDDAVAGFVTGIIVPVDGGFSAYSGV